MDKKKVKPVTEKQLLERIEKYMEQLFDDPKVSPTKFNNMQVALLGAIYIVNDAFGSPRKMRNAWVK